MGQMPVSRAWRCCSHLSRSSCRLMTSARVAGVLETYCTHSWSSCDHSRGGRMELRMSSVWDMAGCASFAFLSFLPLAVAVVLMRMGVLYFTKEACMVPGCGRPRGKGEAAEAAAGPQASKTGALAWQVVAASAMAASDARTACISIALLSLAGLRLALLAQQKEARPADALVLPMCDLQVDDAKDEAEDELAPGPVPLSPSPTPPTLPATPLPQPRLQLLSIGASFVVHDSRITSWRGATLSFTIPSQPASWPLRAVLSRASEDGPWASFELTVDIAAACDLPPLLACTPASLVPHTGGTPFPCVRELPLAQPPAPVADSGGCGEGSPGSEEGGGPWLYIHNGGGHLVASISRERCGACVLRRHDGSSWDVTWQPTADEEEPWMVVSEEGQQLGQAMTRKNGDTAVMQVDTQPAAESPESALLLTCMLAVVTFGP
mmetsp:Transcript_65893/g.204366  ORF Transcript_65893/g.204366 Transcript_65893/m.204366 type:complete len:436 (+) Transcript_65893:528-1835(+)